MSRPPVTNVGSLRWPSPAAAFMQTRHRGRCITESDLFCRIPSHRGWPRRIGDGGCVPAGRATTNRLPGLFGQPWQATRDTSYGDGARSGERRGVRCRAAGWPRLRRHPVEVAAIRRAARTPRGRPTLFRLCPRQCRRERLSPSRAIPAPGPCRTGDLRRTRRAPRRR